MKKIVFVFLLAFNLVSFSQVAPPEAINYQAVARDAGGSIITTAIGIKFEIHQGSAAGTVVYDETNTIIPSSAGIFTAAIGRGTPGIGTFSSSINWGTDKFFLEVSIDPAGGTSYSPVGITELLSVPYALYAKTSGNAGTTYSAGAGISISSGSIINTAMNQTVNISGAGTTTVSGTYPNYIITSSGTSTSVPASSLVINPPHVITNLGPNNNSITIQPTNITATTGIASIGGVYPNYNVFVPPPILNINGSTITVSQGSAVSTQTIGGPWYKSSAATTALTNTNDFVGIGTSTPANRLQIIESTNPFPAANFANTYSVVSNASAMGIFSSASNPHPTSAGVYGTHSSNGNGVSGINSSATSTIGCGLYGYTAGTFSTNVSIQADISAGNSTGIFANGFSSHTGIAIYGLKTGNSGNVAKFLNNNNANSSDALISTTIGQGAAIHAATGTATTSALALHIENGHLKSSSTGAPVSFTTAVVGGFTSPAFAPTCIGTDVKGTISFSTSATGFSPTNSFDIQYNFQKPYAVAPTVVLTPTTDFKGLFYMLFSSSPTGFVIRIYRPNGASFPVSITNTFFSFNYFIIE